jgi:hypothetical protein
VKKTLLLLHLDVDIVRISIFYTLEGPFDKDFFYIKSQILSLFIFLPLIIFPIVSCGHLTVPLLTRMKETFVLVVLLYHKNIQAYFLLNPFF